MAGLWRKDAFFGVFEEKNHYACTSCMPCVMMAVVKHGHRSGNANGNFCTMGMGDRRNGEVEGAN